MTGVASIIKKILFVAILSIAGWFVFQGDTTQAGFIPGTFDFYNELVPTPTSGEPINSAAEGKTASKIESNLSDFFELILKVLYLLLWPLLAIAGASLDNSLVYGDIFYLDKALWQFWQMIRTFANFALGFIFIASIFISFFGAEKKFEKISVKTIIKKLFLAGILINMSWFIVAALLDLSTILVFNVGALPLHVIRQDVENNEGLGKARFLTTHSFYNQDSSVNTERDQLEHSVMYSCPGPDAVEVGPNLEGAGQKTYYLPCWVEAGYFVDRGPIDENNSRDFYKQQYIDAWEGIGNEDVGENISDDYCVRGYDLITMAPGQSFDPANLDVFRKTAEQELKDKNCSTIDRLIEKAHGMTGPMYTLFATILHMGEVGVTVNNKTVAEKGLEFLMRVIVALALFLPLLTLAVVLVMRAVILWLIIAFSPLLTLVYVFGFNISAVKNSNMKDVLGLIFLPVIAVFAISISILFMSLIGRIDLIEDTDPCEVDAFSRLTGAEIDQAQCKQNVKCYKLFGITEICITESERNTGANIVNTLTWLTVNFFGIALMWTIIFAALKSNAITAGIAGKIQDFGKGLAGAATIIPMPGSLGGWTSVGALEKSAKNLGDMPGRITNQQFKDGLGAERASRGARKDAAKIESDMGEKLGEAAKGNTVSYSKGDFAIAENTNYKQYGSLGPSLGMASGKTYAQAKDMSFTDAHSDSGTIKYMQQEGMYTTDHWIKDTGDRGRSMKVDLAKTMEQQQAAQGVSLGADTGNRDTTRFVMGDYVTKFPRGNSAKGVLDGDVVSQKIIATPQKKGDWDEFSKFFMSSNGIRNNPEFVNAFPGYMTKINDAATGAATTRVDTLTDPAHHKTYTITVNKDAATGQLTGFQLS